MTLYLDAGGEVDLKRAAIDNQRPLEAAAKWGRGDAIRVLVERGADVNLRQQCNPDKKFLFLKTVYPHEVSPPPEDDGYDEMIEVVGADHGATPLFLAAAFGHADAVKALVDGGAAVDRTGKYQFWNDNPESEMSGTPLFAACAALRFPTFGPAYDQKTDKYVGGGTGHVEVVRALLNAGASVDAKGVTPTFQEKSERKKCTPLMAVLNAKSSPARTDIVRLLVSHGADTIGKLSGSADGLPAIYVAVGSGDADVVEAMLKAGADASLPFPKPNLSYFTPMTVAAHRGFTDVVRVFLDAGIPVDKPFADGETALTLAAEDGYADPSPFTRKACLRV